MNALCYVNGKILPASQAVLGVSDLALQRGYGVFDYARTYRNRLFHFEDHLRRLRSSAAELHLALPLADGEITAIAERLILESGLSQSAIRLILTGGDSSASLFLHPNFVIIAEERATYPASIYHGGVKLILVEFQRELPHVKSINYLNAIRLEPFKREQEAFDILYHSQHGVTECPRSNFFVFQGDTLVTPSSHILPGITREIILKLAAQYFPVETRRIDPEELSTVDEAFVTATSKGVLPVTTINGRSVGAGFVGDRTRKLMRLFEKYTAAY